MARAIVRLRTANLTMHDILLTTLNARYVHASLGLRYLHANLGELAPRAAIAEFVCAMPTEAIVGRILAHQPKVLGIGVYIWNVEASTRLIERLRAVAPGLRIVVGGPEVSHELDSQRICALADHVITGPGERSFARLCSQLLDGPRPLSKVIAGEQAPLDELTLPYALYTDDDIRHRFLYVEASRGCPFKCEFCLSALDKTAWPFDPGRVIDELSRLHARGARRFKFVDRTFNLKASTGVAILGFFLERLRAAPDDPVFAHFELVPDHLPEPLRDAIVRFPEATLQFEIGIQTWNPAVQSLISRRQNNERAQDNIAWLLANTRAHLHVDLIAGLPGEDLASFGEGFDRLYALGPHEIQVGMLKRLRGAPISRHTEAYGLRFDSDPPYEVLATDRIGFDDMRRIARFARYWELIGNSGRFRRTLALVLEKRPFENFMRFSDWLHAQTGVTHGIALERLYELAGSWLADRFAAEPDVITAALVDDFRASGAQGRPAFLARGLGASPRPGARNAAARLIRRQSRHLA